MDFFLRRGGKLDNLLDSKDALTRVLLDFVDIFNMVEILSVNDCVGVGSFVSEMSSTERAIQAFCTMDISGLPVGEENHQRSERTTGELLYSKVMFVSGFYQNLPFLVIRIVVWVQYKLYSLGFLVKNVIVIILWIGMLYRNDLNLIK